MHCKVATCQSDVLFVAVRPTNPNADCHLGAALFATFPLPELDGEKLLNDLLPHAGKQGLEVARTGGALGRCDPESKDFRKFLSKAGSCLGCKASLMIVVNSGGRLGFYCIYVTPYKKQRTVSYWYNTPRVGGHQMLKEDHLRKHKILREFPWPRVLTAILLEQYNRLYKDEMVASTAARKMMIDWIEAQQHASHYIANTPTPDQDPIKCDPLCWLAMMSKHTLVCHPVGWHMSMCLLTMARIASRTKYVYFQQAAANGQDRSHLVLLGVVDWAQGLSCSVC